MSREAESKVEPGIKGGVGEGVFRICVLFLLSYSD